MTTPATKEESVLPGCFIDLATAAANVGFAWWFGRYVGWW